MSISLKKLGPGLLFAGAAIGVSHLVQSTRAGADFGLGLLWALVLIHIVKYPFFKFGALYAATAKESLLDGYKRLGNVVLVIYAVITFATMFTIQTAVTTVTAGIASSLFNINWPTTYWSLIILIICLLILLKGRYSFLDKLMKIIVIALTVSTIIAVIMAFNTNHNPLTLTQVFPENALEIGFLIAFMGWMPAPLDVSIWHSLWALEKKKLNPETTFKSSITDFNIGYAATLILGSCFLGLGALVMHQSGETFGSSAAGFANQLINMYTNSLGNWAYWLIGIAALTTMFSTTLTTLDASPRSMHKTMQLLQNKPLPKGYAIWVLALTVGSLIILFGFISEMGVLIKIATIISFLTAPFYAILNYVLITSKHMPKHKQPNKAMKIYSWFCIAFLIAFSFWFLSTF
ncbi:NRAMP family divalent metal transporter [Bizionia sediminis]|uniref:NRAMP family divalent metal transporter n=1 Tax=Bizionia sediminis TaxID=1737064 RepID=A0ABW5KVF4_9FLAO